MLWICPLELNFGFLFLLHQQNPLLLLLIQHGTIYISMMYVILFICGETSRFSALPVALKLDPIAVITLTNLW